MTTNSSSQAMSKWHLTALVTILTMIGPFTVDTYLPAFESMELDFNVPRSFLTQTLGAYFIALGASTLVWGALADTFGRKPVILLSIGSYVFASLACALATSYDQFLLFRIIQGLSIGGSLIAGRAMVRDVLDTKDAQKVMAKAMMLFSISPVLAPILGGFLHDLFGWRSIFWFLVIYGSLVFLYALIMGRESLDSKNKSSIRIKQVSSVYLRTLKNPHYIRLVLIFTASFSSFFMFIAGAPTIIFDMLELDATSFYLIFVPVVAGITLGSMTSNRLLNHFNATQIMHFSICAMFTLAFVNFGLNFIFEPSSLRIIAPLPFYSFSLSIMMPVISVEILNCFPNNRGSASAMQNFIQMCFTGFSVNIIVASLGVLIFNFTLAQVLLITIAFVLWLFDLKYTKVPSA